MRRVLSSLLLGACLLGVAACGNDTSTDAKADKLDERLLGKGNADPVLTTALEDQIMVDPSLANMANRNAVKAADAPMTAPVTELSFPMMPFCTAFATASNTTKSIMFSCPISRFPPRRRATRRRRRRRRASSPRGPRPGSQDP